MSEALDRIANALDRLSPIPLARPDFDKCDAFLWQTNPMGLIPISNVSCIDIKLLLGIDNSRDTLRANTEQFSKGFPANNALLWGASGIGDNRSSALAIRSKASLTIYRPIHHQNNHLLLIGHLVFFLPFEPTILKLHRACKLQRIKLLELLHLVV